MSAREIKFLTDPTEEELLRHWTLSKSDKALIRSCRGTAQRYSFALQLCLLRQRGHFMTPQQTRVPLRIVSHLGEQLGFQPTLFFPPLQREATWLEQNKRIRSYLHFKPFEHKERATLAAWLKKQERHDLRRSQLANLAREFLLQRRTMLPADSTIERMVNTEVVRQEKLSFQRLSGQFDRDLRGQIEGLLDVNPATRISTLEWMTQYPPEASPPVIMEYMDRLDRLSKTGMNEVDLRDIRPSMISYCARLAERMTAYKPRRMHEDKRLALVFSLLCRTRQSLLDNLVEMHRTFLIGMNRRARRAVEQRERKALSAARQGLRTLLDAMLACQQRKSEASTDSVTRPLSVVNLRST